MTSEAQKKARAKYNKKAKHINLVFYPPEIAMYEHVCKQDVKQAYIKNLIKQDMKKG